MTIRLLIAYLLNLFDLAMTSYWVSKYGIGIEANSVGRWLYEANIATPVKVLFVGIMFLTLHRSLKELAKKRKKPFEWWDLVSWAILAGYGALAVYHVFLAIMVAIINH